MVVGEAAPTNVKTSFGLTVPIATSAPVISQAYSDSLQVDDNITATSPLNNGNEIGDDNLPVAATVYDVIDEDDGYVMGDQAMVGGEGDGGLWGEGEESEEGGEESDGLSFVGSIADRQSPMPNHDEQSQLGHTPVISDLSDGDMTSLEEGEYDFGYTEIPNGSTSITSLSASQLCLVSATVTGFTTEKGQRKQLFQHISQQQHQQKSQPDGIVANGGGGGLPDIVFIVELTWSDGRVNVVTRTYTDFCRLQYYLINEFVDVPANESPARLNIYLPVRRDVLPEDNFAQAHAEPQDSILLAESRELLLNQYVQELIKLPPKISASPTALTFFESRNSDPVPYRETVDTSRVNVTDQYILCWI